MQNDKNPQLQAPSQPLMGIRRHGLHPRQERNFGTEEDEDRLNIARASSASSGQANFLPTHPQTKLEASPRHTMSRSPPSTLRRRLLRARSTRQGEPPIGSTNPSEGAHRYNFHTRLQTSTRLLSRRRQGRRAVNRANSAQSTDVTRRIHQ